MSTKRQAWTVIALTMVCEGLCGYALWTAQVVPAYVAEAGFLVGMLRAFMLLERWKQEIG